MLTLVLVASSPQQLQEQLDCLSAVASKLRFEVSAKKTEIVVFRPSASSPAPVQEWTLRMGPNSDSPRVTVPVVYLGVTLTFNLNSKPHISGGVAAGVGGALNGAQLQCGRGVAGTHRCILHHGPHP